MSQPHLPFSQAVSAAKTAKTRAAYQKLRKLFDQIAKAAGRPGAHPTKLPKIIEELRLSATP